MNSLGSLRKLKIRSGWSSLWRSPETSASLRGLKKGVIAPNQGVFTLINWSAAFTSNDRAILVNLGRLPLATDPYHHGP